MKVSVVVPVWNPGPNLQRCLDSLLGQSLPAADYEVVLVDDGCTDGTGARLDELAGAQGERVQVLHIPNSGWPGRPRNVGVDAARGEYIQFVDNDDVLAPSALQALYELASSSAADVVVGKLSSDFRGVNHSVFRNTVARRTLADFPLVETLTPHKMFRKAFLEQHQIRFPEGPTHLEDQLYVMRAYVHARSVAILGDRACYFYLRRLGSGRNAGDIAMVPAEYYGALEQVLDVIEQNVPSAELRDRLHRRFYRVELLGRLSGQAMLAYADDYRRDLAACVRAVVTSRFGPGVQEGSGAAVRTQGRLLLDNDLPALVALAEQYTRVTLRATGSGLRWRDGQLQLDVTGALYWGDEPLRCERSGQGWALPAALAPQVPDADRVIDAGRADADCELATVSRADSASFGRTDGLRVHIDGDGVIRVDGTARIDPATAMGGRPLSVGLWDLRLRLRYAGWSRTATLGSSGAPPMPPPALFAADGTLVTPYWTRPKASIALDVGQWAHSPAGELAATSTVERSGNALLCTLRVASMPDAPLPPAELLLQRHDGTGSGLLSCPAELATTPEALTARVRLPRPAQDGQWRIWLRIGDPGGAPPVLLPWRLRHDGRRSIVERAARDST